MQQGGHGASGGPCSEHPSPPEAESTESNLVTITGSFTGVCPGRLEDILGSKRSLSDSPSCLPEIDFKCLTTEQGSFLPNFQKSTLPATTGHDSHRSCPSGGQPPESRCPSVRAAPRGSQDGGHLNVFPSHSLVAENNAGGEFRTLRPAHAFHSYHLDKDRQVGGHAYILFTS